MKELHLTDAVQIRITIQHLVQSGLVDDDKAVAVKEQLALEKAANDGNGDALYEMGRRFQAKVLRDIMRRMYAMNFKMVRITGG